MSKEQQGFTPENQGQTRKPGQELTADRQSDQVLAHSLTEQQNLQRQGRSHEELVRGFQEFIAQRQQLYQSGSTDKRVTVPPAEIIRDKLEWESIGPTEVQGEFFTTVRLAWDALAYEHYTPGTLAENLAGANLSHYYQATREPAISLSDPTQVRMIDAMTEAAGVTHQRGEAAILIPDKLKNHTKWILSQEYQERLARAKMKSGK